jgi:hypothetical protein
MLTLFSISGRYMYKLHNIHEEWIADIKNTYSNAVIEEIADGDDPLPFMSIAHDENGCLIGSFCHYPACNKGFTKTHTKG